MVTVTNYAQKKSSDGKKFFSLELTGEVEFALTKTGKSFATARKCTIPSTFDEITCKALVGKQMPGIIKKIEVQEYEYKVPKTGEVITLSHRYEYCPEDNSMEKAVFQQELAL